MGRVKNKFKDYDYEYDEYNDESVLKEEKKKGENKGK